MQEGSLPTLQTAGAYSIAQNAREGNGCWIVRQGNRARPHQPADARSLTQASAQSMSPCWLQDSEGVSAHQLWRNGVAMPWAMVGLGSLSVSE